MHLKQNNDINKFIISCTQNVIKNFIDILGINFKNFLIPQHVLNVGTLEFSHDYGVKVLI